MFVRFAPAVCLLILVAVGGCAGRVPGAAATAAVPCGSRGEVPAAGHCGLVCRTELPVQLQDGMPMVTVWIGDRAANMLLDTGAAVTSLTTDGARRLGLAHTTAAPGRIWGIGGGQDRAMVTLPRLAFGDISSPAAMCRCW